ncbi:MAG TPA: protein-glutamate O-methyltransferase CheR [Steroidobacteraceae bacterium]|jgi:chemotaxis protein methyltransferase CheR|nr:protein-glutamate O-methyltransferase CheR [Steroidobacteraceae bacterium]
MAAGVDHALLREYAFSDEDFQQIRRLVKERIGIHLAAGKRELVYGRISRRLRALGLAGFGEYLQRLERGDVEELQQFCNAITTNLTAFFREAHHFRFLARELLPALTRDNADTRRLRIWSAGCSSGEEPWSIAMVVLETLGALRQWDLRILATDVDTGMLRLARRGLYTGERLEKVAGERLLRWFEPGAEEHQYRVCEELRRLVSFKALNLVGSWPMRGPFDVIFCRNVLMYFSRDTQREIVRRMASLQRTGDYLILGHSESLLDVSTQYRLAGQTVYRRRSDGSVR